MVLDEIAENVSLENDTCEYKRRLNHDNPIDWLKTAAGFANAHGGDLFLGVEDGSLKLVGYSRSEADAERNYFNNLITQHLTPRPEMTIAFLRYEIHESERYIIKVHVKESEMKPVILNWKGVPSIYMRREGFTNGATYEEIINMSIRTRKVQYDLLPSDIPFETDHFNKLRQLYSERNQNKKLTDKTLRSIGFYDEKGFLANGAVLFEDNYDGDKTAVKCSVFSGFNRGSERIITMNAFQGNVIDTIHSMLEFVTTRMNHTMIKLPASRQNIDAYPSRALYEGIVNAVAHRDYYISGSQIQVDMFKDRLEILSPGSFYQGEKIDRTYDLTHIISKQRNVLISEVFKRCNIMETEGTGFEKIAEDYAEADEHHRPFISSYSDHFTLVLPDLTYEKGVMDNGIAALSYPAVPNGTKYDDLVLGYCYEQPRTVAEIASLLDLKNSSYLRKKILGNLAANNYLIITKKRPIMYRTNRDMTEKM